MNQELAIRETALQLGAFSLARTGVKIEGTPSFEEWQQAYAFVERAEQSVMWWIGDLLNYGETHYGEVYTQAMDATGLKYQAVADAKWVAGAIEFSSRDENVGFYHHKAVAPFPPGEQKKWLAKAVKGKLSVADLRAAIRENRLTTALGSNPLPKEQYRVIYADPPWKYADELIEGYGAAEHHYPTMTAEELSALKVSELAATDAVLFLWATVPMLPDSLKVIAAWGFTYKTLFVWDKVKHNYGHYNSVRAELLLICTRGSCLPDSDKLPDSVVTIERSEKHSEKPEEFRELIDSLYTSGSRVELFARKKVTGWDAWGNEINERQEE